MFFQITHNATITVQLPVDMTAREEADALRKAGIPINEWGVASSGYLFVRTTGRVRKINTFRWFATVIGRAPADVVPAPAAGGLPPGQLSLLF